VPVVDVHLAIAPVHLDDRRDQRDHVRADGTDVRRLVHRQPVRQFHQGGHGAGLARVERAGDVVDGHRGGDERLGLPIVETDRPRIGQLRQARPVLVHPGQHRGVGHGGRDHLPPFFGPADREHSHPRARLLEHPEVPVHVGAVRQLAGRAGNVADDGLRRRNGLRRGEVVHQGRREERRRRVLLDLRGVRGVDLLRRGPGPLAERGSREDQGEGNRGGGGRAVEPR